MKLQYFTYTDVEKYLTQKKIIIIPIGSTEQHSPDGLLGTDYLIADAIAQEVGKRIGILVAPVINVGIAIHHLGFAGTISYRPTTLITVLEDYINSLIRHGFNQFFFINGHGGNIPTVQAASAQITLSHRIKSEIVSWWHLPQVLEKENELFGAENGKHATVSEISVTRFLHPDAFRDGQGFEKPLNKDNYCTEMPDYAWPLSPEGFREIFPFGNMGSNPASANADKGRIIFNLAVDTISQMVQQFYGKRF